MEVVVLLDIQESSSTSTNHRSVGAHIVDCHMWVKWEGKFTANLNRHIHITEKSLKQYQKINSAFLSNQAIIPMKSDCQRLQHRKVKFKVNMLLSRENLRQSQRLVHKDRFLMQHSGAVVYRYANKFSAMLTTFPSMFQSTQSLPCKLLLVLISGSIPMLLPQQTAEMIEKCRHLGICVGSSSTVTCVQNIKETQW